LQHRDNTLFNKCVSVHVNAWYIYKHIRGFYTIKVPGLCPKIITRVSLAMKLSGIYCPKIILKHAYRNLMGREALRSKKYPNIINYKLEYRIKQVFKYKSLNQDNFTQTHLHTGVCLPMKFSGTKSVLGSYSGSFGLRFRASRRFSGWRKSCVKWGKLRSSTALPTPEDGVDA